MSVKPSITIATRRYKWFVVVKVYGARLFKIDEEGLGLMIPKFCSGKRGVVQKRRKRMESKPLPGILSSSVIHSQFPGVKLQFAR